MTEVETELKKYEFLGGETYCLCNSKSHYVLRSDNEVICTYKKTRDGIIKSVLNPAKNYFFSKEAMKKCEEYLRSL